MSTPVVEILAIGTELLLGDTIDTNSAWLGAHLAAAGLPVARRTTVVDDFDLMAGAMREALARAGVLICTGGLGPTHDDFTREVVAAVIARPLELDDGWLRVLHERYDQRGIPMPTINRRQAMAPAGAVVLPNPRGSAPGLWIEHEDRVIVLLPGVPYELHTLAEQEVLPRLAARHPDARPVRSVHVRTSGVPESRLAERIDDIVREIEPLDVAFLPRAAGVDVRVTARGLPAAEADARLVEARNRLSQRVGAAHFADGDTALPAVLGDLLRSRALRVAFAESCTGGLAAKLMTDAAGASDYVQGGVVAYANEVKSSVLGVPEETLRAHGAVSEETVRAMASGVRRVCHAECGIAITGVAGPGGGSEERPVGTVWIAAETPDASHARRLRLLGYREEIRERSAYAALDLLRRMLLGVLDG